LPTKLGGKPTATKGTSASERVKFGQSTGVSSPIYAKRLERVAKKRARELIDNNSDDELESLPKKRGSHVRPHCKDNQASIPKFIPPSKRSTDLDNDKSMLVWSPNTSLRDHEIDDFVAMAKDKYEYTTEQALGMLFSYSYDIKKAVAMLSGCKPYQDEWT
jgi:hypothetical protein